MPGPPPFLCPVIAVGHRGQHSADAPLYHRSRTDPHLRLLYTLWLVEEGRLQPDGAAAGAGAAGPGEVLLLPPGSGLVAAPQTAWVALAFTLTPLPATAGRTRVDFDHRPQPAWETLFGHDLPAVVPPEHGREIASLVPDLHRLYALPRTGWWADARLGAWLTDYALATGGNGSPDDGFADLVDETFRLHLADGIDVGRAARRLGVSRSCLERRYRRERDEPPGAALDRIRLDRAFRGLRSRERRVDQTAQACGFRSTSSFARWFRRRTGVTPRRWRSRQALTHGARVLPRMTQAEHRRGRGKEEANTG